MLNGDTVKKKSTDVSIERTLNQYMANVSLASHTHRSSSAMGVVID